MREPGILGKDTIKRVVNVLMALLFVLIPAGTQAATDAYEEAIAKMAAEPAAAETAMMQRDDGVGELDRMLFLFAFKPQDAARDDTIRALQGKIHRAVIPMISDLGLEIMADPVPFDGSVESLLPTVIIASNMGYANSHSAFYAIPCAILQREPALLAVLSPLWGSNRDNFMPRSGCDWGRGAVAGYPADLLDAYVRAAYATSGDMFARDRGTIRFAHIAGQRQDMQYAMIAPADMPPAPAGDIRPFETWSYLSLANRRIYEGIDRHARALEDAVFAYWQGQGKSEDMARQHARDTLFSVVFGGDCQTPVPGDAMRVMLLEDRPTSAIAAQAKQGKGGDDTLFDLCAIYAGIDPLIHIAVVRPDTLPVLSENGYFPDVEGRNRFGKTALMTAAQYGNLTAVKWLLDQGADVGALTDPGDEWFYPRHGRRSVLHYAVASGDVAIVRALIDAGGDVSVTDDQGFDLRDYLLGRDDLPGNVALTQAEKDAILLLLG
ncbi:ankyrin repeat domain-containing protein [Thalassospira sp.]|uniref:ankyrin repeat domain-containing protein n=1 Tax=Thalassospira sp. TaxID=1912094 RepID=UPI00273287B9|nr:ankyrin repeat domain-containing protein [Thalassospira sp.]MDP2698878.1 ankyrin repeat domain-containing protein [Thalassospira sp.]